MNKAVQKKKKGSSTESIQSSPGPSTCLWGRWIYLIPTIGILWVWLSSLSFVPVPWPDDSAFYFPAKDLFSWPPRWVMIPQAPFEPTYRIWNFNTMPLFPILIGFFRLIGISTSHALKILPLGGWLLGIFFVLHSLRRNRASLPLLLGAAFVLSFEPILRWSSTLIRPESLIGAMGLVILFGFRFGWPNLLRERRYFHPVSFCLLAAALLHFNAIHLVPLVVALYAFEIRKILKIGVLTAIGLIPWGITILAKPDLFAQQMALQFSRLSGFSNPWLSSWTGFSKALLENMGSPEAWGPIYEAGIFISLAAIPFLLFRTFSARLRTREGATLVGAFVWLLSALYLWHTKAEVWFTHYFHLAFWAWTILVLYELKISNLGAQIAILFPLGIGILFLLAQTAQTIRLESTETWHWKVYDRWVECIDSVLTDEFIKRGRPGKFTVWDPTFPDITIALSNLHPDWEFTRTNDFMSRADLAVEHGFAVDAMVVTETFRTDERKPFKGELTERPSSRSVWMDWEGYFLNRLEVDPAFKPRRFLCQQGRWDAFIYLN